VRPRQINTPSAPMYAPTPNRVAPRRSAPTTTAAAARAPSMPPTAPAIVSGVSPMARPDRAAENGSDDRGRADSENVRPEDPGDCRRDTQPEAEAEPDRVPATHAGSVERASASLRSGR
jgi:hypothetical protein